MAVRVKKNPSGINLIPK